MRKSYIISLIIFALGACGCLRASAQEWIETRHFQADVSVGLNTDGYETDLGFTWWPVQNFGFRLSIGLAGELEEIGDWDWLYGDDYYYDDYDYDYATRFKFMPSLMMRSPTLINWDDQSTTFHIFANPGLCLSPGASGSEHADWFSWQLRGGIEAEIGEECIISLGYGYSNYNLYSGNPWSYNGGYEERMRHTHSVFIMFGYKF